jgi:hypothetical protein
LVGFYVNSIDWQQLYCTFIKYSKTLEEKEQWFNSMITKGLAPKHIAYNNVIESCSSLAEVQKWIRKMRQNGIEPNQETYFHILNKCQKF